MQIRYIDGKWIASATYAEKHLLSRRDGGAGFKWDPEWNRWWTDDGLIASRVIEYCDDDAARAIAETVEAEIDASRAQKSEIVVPVPEGLELLPFQVAGVEYCMGREHSLIADEMGCGKSVESIALGNLLSADRILVICPASLKLNWMSEMLKWQTIDRPVCAIRSSKDKFQIKERQVVIINYELVRAHMERIRELEWDFLIVDEAHYLKNGKAKRTKAVLHKRGVMGVVDRAVFLTGTPILNRPSELWTLLRVLDPEGLGKSWRNYHERYCAAYQNRWGWDVSGASNLEELSKTLRARVMVRRLKKDVLTELPPKRRQVIEIPANGCAKVVAAEKKAFESHEEELELLRREVDSADLAGDHEVYRKAVAALREGIQSAFEEMASLRKQVAVAKVAHVVELVKEAAASHPVLVFAHHHEVIDGLNYLLVSSGLSVAVLDGRKNIFQRQEAVEDFQGGLAQVFIGGIHAAGVGLTLTRASHVIFAEIDWVPGIIDQAEDRCHRIGQENSVLVQHLVLEGSLDATMAKRIVAKQEVISSSLDGVAVKGDRMEVSGIPRGRGKELPEMSEDQMSAALRAVKVIAGDCDGAVALDGKGFSASDAGFGKILAGLDSLTPRQAAVALKLAQKYRRQVPAEILAECERGQHDKA